MSLVHGTTIGGVSGKYPNVQVSLAGTGTAPIDNTSDGGGLRNVNFGNITLTTGSSGDYLRFIIENSCHSNTSARINSVTIGGVNAGLGGNGPYALDTALDTLVVNQVQIAIPDPGWPSINVQAQIQGSGSNSCANRLVVLRLRNVLNPRMAAAFATQADNVVANIAVTGGGTIIVTNHHAQNANPSLGNLNRAYTEVINRINGPGSGRGLSVYYRTVTETDEMVATVGYPLTNTISSSQSWVNLIGYIR